MLDMSDEKAERGRRRSHVRHAEPHLPRPIGTLADSPETLVHALIELAKVHARRFEYTPESFRGPRKPTLAVFAIAARIIAVPATDTDYNFLIDRYATFLLGVIDDQIDAETLASWLPSFTFEE